MDGRSQDRLSAHYSFPGAKPGAFALYRFGRTFFPHQTSRLPMSPYAAFVGACRVEYVVYLATTME